MASSYTNSIQITKPGVGDPASQNTWGFILNQDFDLIDTALGGIQTLALTNSNVILTSIAGSPDQSRAAVYVLSGTLTGNIVILWPQNLSRKFSVVNNTTGAFTVTLGANNGSGSAAGTTQVINQGFANEYYSDGVNINALTTGAGPKNGDLTLSVAGNANVVLTQQQATNGAFAFTGALTGNIDVLWPVGFAGIVQIFNDTTGNFTLNIGLNNGSGSPSGTTYFIPQGGATFVIISASGAAGTVNIPGVASGSPEGTFGLNVAGNTNVTVTQSLAYASGLFFTGALTGNIDVLWPAGFTGVVQVFNNTTGAFTLSIGINNGSGSPAGGVYLLPQGGATFVVFDGTNCAGTINLLGISQATADLHPKAQAVMSVSGGTLTVPTSTNCTVSRLSTGTFQVTMTGGYNFTAAGMTGSFYDGSKPMEFAPTTNPSGVNPVFTFVTYNEAGSITDPATGAFQVIGK